MFQLPQNNDYLQTRLAVNTVAAPQQGTNVNDKVHFQILILLLIKDMSILQQVKLNLGDLVMF